MGDVSDIANSYPELNYSDHSIQLSMFRNQYKYESTADAARLTRSLVPEVQQLFTQVKELLLLLLVNPASSVSAERSFSALRRLLTWLRSTMTQERLNSCAVCNVHSDLLDEVDIHSVASEFASCNNVRRRIFGQFVEHI
jgi:nitrate/nitrite-specific signal transduction histidine kinase